MFLGHNLKSLQFEPDETLPPPIMDLFLLYIAHDPEYFYDASKTNTTVFPSLFAQTVELVWCLWKTLSGTKAGAESLGSIKTTLTALACQNVLPNLQLLDNGEWTQAVMPWCEKCKPRDRWFLLVLVKVSHSQWRLQVDASDLPFQLSTLQQLKCIAAGLSLIIGVCGIERFKDVTVTFHSKYDIIWVRVVFPRSCISG